MKYIFLILFALIFASCYSKEASLNKNTQPLQKAIEVPKKEIKFKKEVEFKKELKSKKELKKHLSIDDLTKVPQDVSFFTKKLNSSVEIYNIQNKYEQYYFNVWNDTKPRESLKIVKWPFYAYKAGDSYGENFQLLKQEFFDEMLKNANFGAFGTLNAKAVTLRNTSIRGFPTMKPLLKDPTKAGEGFPFDYLQNSTVHANKPVFVTHYSKDREWVHVFSSFTSGWMKVSNIAFLKKEHIDAWQKAQQIFLIKENIPLYNEDNNFLFHSKIGMMLALISQNDKNYIALAVTSSKNAQARFEKVIISKEIARKYALNLNRESLENIMSELIDKNYGWGGLYGQRDCSSTLRDMYAPFGIWLPRNSSQQAKIGKIISLNGLSDEEKIAVIKEKAVAFQTLLYKKGHIVLYVGTLDDEIVIFHNMWGIKTKKNGVEGRVVVGKTIFSTLKLGEHLQNYDKKAEILRNLTSMNILTQ